MTRFVSSLVLILVILGLGFGLGTYTGPQVKRFFGATPPPSIKIESLPPMRSALGKILPASGIISIAGQPGDRVVKLYVGQHAEVKEGAPLVEFSSHQAHQQELEQAKKQVEAAEAQLKAIDEAEKSKLRELTVKDELNRVKTVIETKVDKLKIEALEERVKQMRTEYQRLTSLDPRIAQVAEQDLQKVRTALVVAESERDAALVGDKARSEQADKEKQLLNAAREAVRAESNLARARVPLDTLKQQVQLATLRLSMSLLKAPRDGRILRTFVHEGDTVSQGPILQMASGSEMIVLAEVPARDVSAIYDWMKQEGTRVEARVSSPELSTELKGEVRNRASIATIVAQNALKGFSPRADSDRRIIEIRVDLDKSAWDEAARFIGSEVNVTLSPNPPPS